uniref:Uncharacterized protein n=1 Tax=viral metagenome TaxID=1070528 RepID=A0A6C0C7M9_9ZZZZ
MTSHRMNQYSHVKSLVNANLHKSLGITMDQRWLVQISLIRINPFFLWKKIEN